MERWSGFFRELETLGLASRCQETSGTYVDCILAPWVGMYVLG